jgi:hypothetical protein
MWTNSDVRCAETRSMPTIARSGSAYPNRFSIARNRENARGAWLSHESPEASVMMQIPGVGPFVRALLVVRLVAGYAVTYGVWVGAHPDDLQHAFRVWWESGYETLRLEGRLANSVPPWGLLAPPVTLAVKDPEHAPYCVSSSDHMLSRVLGQKWPHKDVLEALP